MKPRKASLPNIPILLAILLFPALILGVTHQALAGLNLEVPIEMVDHGLEAPEGGGTTTNMNRSRIFLDSGDYDGDTVNYYFEIVAKNTDTVDRNVYFRRTTGTADDHATITVPAGTSDYTRFRVALSTPPLAGKNNYVVRVTDTNFTNQLYVSAARVLVQQTNATKTRIQIPLVQKAHDAANVGSGRADKTTSTDYTQGDPVKYSLWVKDSTKYATLSGSTPWTLEAVLDNDSASAYTYAALHRVSDGAKVDGAEVSLYGSTITLIDTSFSDTATNFSDGAEFELKIKTSVAGQNAHLGRASLYVSLTDLSRAEVLYRVSRQNAETAAEDIVEQRALLITSLFTSPAVYFEATGSCADDAPVLFLRDHGANPSGTGGSDVSGSEINFNSGTKTIVRTGKINPTSGSNFYVREAATTGDLIPTHAWIVVTFPYAIVNESFEATGAYGYDEAGWAEVADAGCTLDENTTAIPGTPPVDLGNECLKSTVLNTTSNDAYSYLTKTDQNISYVQGFIYLDEEGLDNGQLFTTLGLYDSSQLRVAAVEIGQSGGAGGLRFTYWSNGVLNYTGLTPFALDTWYEVEYKYDITNLLWEIRINGVTKASGPLETPIRTPRTLLTGVLGYGGTVGQATLYSDLVVWDDDNWPDPGISGAVDVSGTVYESEGGPPVGADVTISLKVDGEGVYSDTTDDNGEYYISAVDGVSAGSTVTVWIDDDTTYEGTSVTVAKGSTTDITGLDIYGSAVIVRSEAEGGCSGTASYETPVSATASSELSATYAASKAIDGSIYSYWFSESGSPPDWIYFDLGSKKCISAINVVIVTADVPMTMDIQVSDDALSWTTVVTGWTVSTGNTWVEKTFSEIEGRYIRLYETAYPRTYGECSEFQAQTRTSYGSENSITNAHLADYDKDDDSDIHFTSNGGTLTVDNDHELHVWTGTSFYPGGAVTTSPGGSGGGIHIGEEATLAAGGPISCGGSWTADSGSTFAHNSNTATFTATTAGKTITSNGRNFYDLTFNGVGGNWTFQGVVYVNQDLTITNGTVNGPAGGTITVGGNWSNSDTFIHNSSTVTFNGAGAQTVTTGGSDWYNIAITNIATGGVGVSFTDGFSCATFTDTTAGSTLYFKANETATITAMGGLTLAGVSGNLITLRRYGGVDPDQWYIHPSGGSWSVSYVDVKDSHNLYTTYINPSESVDSGNTTNWCDTPEMPSSPSPSHGTTGVSIDTDLNWADCTYADYYDVYFGTDASPPLYASNVTVSSYDLPTLQYQEQYYWKVVAKNSCGATNEGAAVWSFTTPPCPTPGTPSSPSPAHGATGVSIASDLNWGNSSYTNTYDVYFDTVTPPVTKVASDITVTYYSLPYLGYNTPYYWKVVAKNACGNSTDGPVWNFTTEPVPPSGDLFVWGDNPDPPQPPYDTWEKAAPTIQAAINVASAGQTVLVRAGTYTENITMKSGVNVVSEGGGTSAAYDDPWSYHSPDALQRAMGTIIDGGGTGPVVSFDETVTAATTLDGFTIQNIDDTVTTTVPLIRIRGCSPTIKNNIIRDNLGISHNGGIGIDGRYDTIEILSSPTIENNLIHHVNGPGVGNSSYSAATIRNNRIWDCNGSDGTGIGLAGDTWPTIEDNVIFENERAGIGSRGAELNAMGGTLIIPPMKGNTIYDNLAGISLEAASEGVHVTIGDSDKINDIYDNGKSASGGGGVVLRYVDTATIQYNDIHHNNPPGMGFGGISLAGVAETDIIGNQIHDNFVGIILRWANGLVTIRENTIYDNSFANIGTMFRYMVWLNGTVETAIVENNKIYGGYAGILNTGISSLHVIGNDIYNNGKAGIRLEMGSGTITQNNIYGNGAGIGVGTQHYAQGNGSVLPTTPDYVITKNNIYHNTSHGGIGFERDSLDAIPTFVIRQNKVYEQTNTNEGGGIQVVSTPGSITVDNNLVYKNKRGGILVGDSAASVMSNTVINNGNTTNDVGGGIIFDDGQGLMGDPPFGAPLESFYVKNNIAAYNVRAGLRACFYDTEDVGGNLFRDYNLLYSNNQEFLAGLCGTCASSDCSTGDRRDQRKCRGAQLGAGCDGETTFCCSAIGATGPLPGETLIFSDPLFEDVANDDYHLQAGSPAIGAGENGVDMGCYGGDYPMHNLIDVDTNTGNTPSGGTIILFDLGDEYTVVDVRLYGTNAYPARDWEVLLGTGPTDCDLGTWGASGGTWSVGGGVQPGWYPHTLTPSSVTGTYLKLISTGALNEHEVFELQFKETTSTYWRTPLKVYKGAACSDISG